MRKYSIPCAPKMCATCGELLQKRDNECQAVFNMRRTCSQACRSQLAKRTRLSVGIDPPRAQLVCETCGKHFECKQSDRIGAKGSIKRFCSRQCQGIARRRTDWSYPTPAQIQFTCPVCGKEKIGWKNYNPKRCSFQCAALVRSRDKGLAQPTKPERAISDTLTEFGVDFEAQRIVFPFVVDFYLPAQNLVIECLGDYHHCNPAKFPDGPVDDRQRRAVERDAKRYETLRSLGYRVATIWEGDIKRGDIREITKAALT